MIGSAKRSLELGEFYFTNQAGSRLDPTLRVSSLAEWLPIRRQQDLAIFSDGLRQAGLPE